MEIDFEILEILKIAKYNFHGKIFLNIRAQLVMVILKSRRNLLLPQNRYSSILDFWYGSVRKKISEIFGGEVFASRSVFYVIYFFLAIYSMEYIDNS